MSQGVDNKETRESCHFARGGLCVCLEESNQVSQWYRNWLQAGEGQGEVGRGGHSPGFQIPEAETWSDGEGGRKHLICCQQLATAWILSLCYRSLRTPEVTFQESGPNRFFPEAVAIAYAMFWVKPNHYPHHNWLHQTQMPSQRQPPMSWTW